MRHRHVIIINVRKLEFWLYTAVIDCIITLIDVVGREKLDDQTENLLLFPVSLHFSIQASQFPFDLRVDIVLRPDYIELIDENRHICGFKNWFKTFVTIYQHHLDIVFHILLKVYVALGFSSLPEFYLQEPFHDIRV